MLERIEHDSTYARAHRVRLDIRSSVIEHDSTYARAHHLRLVEDCSACARSIEHDSTSNQNQFKNRLSDIQFRGRGRSFPVGVGGPKDRSMTLRQLPNHGFRGGPLAEAPCDVREIGPSDAREKVINIRTARFIFPGALNTVTETS